jgi:RNA polymerase sigma-70 factor (ECF subfamily)
VPGAVEDLSSPGAAVAGELRRPRGDEAGSGSAYQRGPFAWAAEQVRPQVREATWQAFRQTAVEGKAGREVARGLGLTTAAVYLAKARVTARLRALIREVQDQD